MNSSLLSFILPLFVLATDAAAQCVIGDLEPDTVAAPQWIGALSANDQRKIIGTQSFALDPFDGFQTSFAEQVTLSCILGPASSADTGNQVAQLWIHDDQQVERAMATAQGSLQLSTTLNPGTYTVTVRFSAGVGGDWPYQLLLATGGGNPDCSNSPTPESCGTVESNIVLDYLGSPLAADDYFTFVLASVPFHQNVMIVGSNARTPGTPFGNSTLCLEAPILRLSPAVPAMVPATLLELPHPPAITAGNWYFQAWYRQPHLGAGFAMSRLVRVPFHP